jgi:hypothetical protein
MFGLSRLRLVEIGIALVLTLAALVFVGVAFWTSDVELIEVSGPR